MITLVKQSQAQRPTPDAHRHPEMTDAMAPAKTDDTGRVHESARTHGEKGAGLEIAATETEGIRIGMVGVPTIVRGAPAETAATNDEVSMANEDHEVYLNTRS